MNTKIQKSDAEWRTELSPEQYEVLRRKGTERATRGGDLCSRLFLGRRGRVP